MNNTCTPLPTQKNTSTILSNLRQEMQNAVLVYMLFFLMMNMEVNIHNRMINDVIGLQDFVVQQEQQLFPYEQQHYGQIVDILLKLKKNLIVQIGF